MTIKTLEDEIEKTKWEIHMKEMSLKKYQDMAKIRQSDEGKAFAKLCEAFGLRSCIAFIEH